MPTITLSLNYITYYNFYVAMKKGFPYREYLFAPSKSGKYSCKMLIWMKNMIIKTNYFAGVIRKYLINPKTRLVIFLNIMYISLIISRVKANY